MRSRARSASSPRISPTLERRFETVLRKNVLIPGGSRVLVGVSGGPDSSALLLLLQHGTTRLDYCLEAAYFDHQIRPMAEREDERATVRSLVGSAGVTLHEGSAPVPDLARANRHSLEEEARLQRYAFLSRIAERRAATLVALGHTADDQAETILLHILRGSGLRGLVGMRLSQAWPFGTGPRLIRPLLGFARRDTEAYCRSHGFAPHTDSLNASLEYARNRVRHQLLPAMRELNPNAGDALLRLSRAAVASEALVGDMVEGAMADSAGLEDGSAWLPVDLLRTAQPAVMEEILLRAFEHVAGTRSGMSERLIQALGALLQTHGEHSLDLPHGVVARLQRRSLLFQRSTAPSTVAGAGSRLPECALVIPGRTLAGAWQFEAKIVDAPYRAATLFEAIFDLSDLAAGLRVRSRLPGDRLHPVGIPGTKKVQDILTDAKAPRSERDSVPIVCLGGDVVWIVGHRRAARAESRLSSGRLVAVVARLDGPAPAG